MKSSLISVIVPIYNVEKYIDKCVESIVNQTYTNLEIILVDDGSPDNCPQMCDEWANKDNRIVVVHKNNGGVSSARNAGLEVATGEYISFIDSDDVIHPQFYEILISKIGNADICYCKYSKFNNEYVPLIKDIENIKSVKCVKDEIFSNREYSYSVVWNKIIKKEIINNLRFDITKKNGEDTLFSFQSLAKCDKVVFVNEELYGYYVREDGAVNTIDVQGRMNLLEVSKEIYKLAVDKGITHMVPKINLLVIVNTIDLFYATEDKTIIKECKRFLLQNIINIIKDKKNMNFKAKIKLFIDIILK